MMAAKSNFRSPSVRWYRQSGHVSVSGNCASMKQNAGRRGEKRFYKPPIRHHWHCARPIHWQWQNRKKKSPHLRLRINQVASFRVKLRAKNSRIIARFKNSPPSKNNGKQAVKRVGCILIKIAALKIKARQASFRLTSIVKITQILQAVWSRHQFARHNQRAKPNRNRRRDKKSEKFIAQKTRQAASGRNSRKNAASFDRRL